MSLFLGDFGPIKPLTSLLDKSLEQTFSYADISDATEAHLMVFDKRPDIDWEQKIFRETKPHKSRTISLWGM